MEVTYQLERDDYWGYNTFIIGRVPALKRQMLLSFVLLPVALTFDLWIFHVGGSTIWLLVFGAALFILWAALLRWSRKRAFLRTVEAKPGSLGLHTLALSAEGLREQSTVMEGRVNWPKITEVTESKHLLVFLISPRFGFIVPKRAFAKPEQAQAFLETARAYRRAALDGTTPMLPPVPETWPPAPQRIL